MNIQSGIGRVVFLDEKRVEVAMAMSHLTLGVIVEEQLLSLGDVPQRVEGDVFLPLAEHLEGHQVGLTLVFIGVVDESALVTHVARIGRTLGTPEVIKTLVLFDHLPDCLHFLFDDFPAVYRNE